jgi:uncharacterized protein
VSSAGELPPKRPAFVPPPLSPCIKWCRMDDERRYCLGCRRTIDEISGWWGMSDAEKRAVLAALAERAPARG